ncbi:hypothetical protein SUDANB174_06474 [Streptomyces sp. enrichment culture]
MKKRLWATGAVLGVLTTAAALPPAALSPVAEASPHPHGHPPSARQALHLGPARLPETRTTTTLQPGVHKPNPRTLAGVDAAGRTVLVTADGRSTDSLGLSIGESAEVARSLGLRDAVNLDGGGSTTLVAEGAVLNSPSDAAGERPVGDALLILPRRHGT